MKQIITLLIAILLLSGCTSNTASEPINSRPSPQSQTNQNPKATSEKPGLEASKIKNKVEPLLKKQFEASSKAIIENLLIDNNKIAINLSGSDDLGPIAIDVALVLNRNVDIPFETVEIKNSTKKASFNKDLFNSFRTGKINDIQFINSLAE